MGKLIAAADVFCLFSDYEAHPIAVMEAIGAGTRALVGDNSGMSELGRAGLVETISLEASPAQVTAAVLALAGAPKAIPPSLPTWDDCAQQLHSLYLGLVK